MLTPESVHDLVNQFLRDGGPSIHVVYCDTKNFVLGVRRLSADLISDKDAFSREVFANLPFAPTNFFLDIPPVDRARSSEETIRAAVDAVRKVADDARLMRIYLIDAIMTDGTGFYSMHRSHREARTIFELPRASVTASAGNAAGEANEDDRSEIQRQEADVIARFTNPDGTKKESWMKYEDGTPITGLTERQFVQVQTPNFKRYFGDWQSLIIRNMLDQTPAPVIQEGAFKKIEGESVWDAASRLLKNHVTHKTRIGNVIIDSRSAQDSLNQGKNQAKLDALVSIQCDFKNAVYITSTPHRKKKKTMEHYFAYPVMYNGEREIVFCTVEEDINKNRLYLHDVVIERDLIDESNTHTTGARGNSSRHDGGVAHSRSILLSLYRVNTNDVSKIVDRHGWPLKVYHGATEEFWSFDKTKQRMNRSGDAFWATTSMAVARTYAGSSGVIREGFVNVRNAKRINANNAPHFKVKAGAHTGTSRIVGRTNRKHFDGVIFDKVKDVNAFNMNLSPATSIAFFEPNQFKSATDNTGAFDPAEYDIRLSITAYHGTPHDFERFDHSFMGSGEGAQAYGWGTYLSAVEGVARGYAERLWGKAIRKANKSGIMVKLLRDKHVINEIIPFQERQLKDLYQRRESFAKRGVVNNHTEQKIQELEDSISSMKKRLQEINEAVANIPKPYKRNLLTVEIPDDSGTNYIHWNAPLTQSQIDVLRASGEIDDDADLHSGGALYEYLTEKLCGQQEASLFLSSLGFTGIKVPVNNTHGGNANGDMNYVIFKEDDIKVVDHERWSIVGKKGIENIAGAHQARAALETARAMENVGIDSKKIFLATGWERGKDLLWRYELPDPKLKPEIAEKFSRNEKVSVVFEDAFDAPELFEAYPQLRRWLLEIDNIPTIIYAGVTLESFDTIRINRALRRNPKEALSTIVHEVQHIIQGIEGFHKGSSVELMEERIKNVEHAYNVRSNALKEFTDRPDFIAKLDELMPWDKPDVDFDAGEKAFKQWLREQPWYDRYEYALERVAQVEDVLRDIRKADYSPETMYHRNSGETEARNASARMALSPEQRRTMAFSETEDVDRADQIIIDLSQEAEAAAAEYRQREAALNYLSGQRLSTTAVSGNGTLVACHNLTENKALAALELGGLPMPSIAITKPEIGHHEFGEISFIFDRSSIDPKTNRANEIFTRDAWSPTFPRIDYVANRKVVHAIAQKYRALKPTLGEDVTTPLYRLHTEAEEMLWRHDGEAGLVEFYSDNDNMMRCFLLDTQGKVIPLVQREEEQEYKVKQNAQFAAIVDRLGADVITQAVTEEEQLRIVKENEDLFGKTISHVAIYMFGKLQEYVRNGPAKTTQTVTDEAASQKALHDAVDTAAFHDWLHSLIDGMVEKKALRKDVDPFYPDGRRKSFAQTHMPVTLENVVKAMKQQPRQGGGPFGGTIFGHAAQKFPSIPALKENEGMLADDHTEEVKALIKAIEQDFMDLSKELCPTEAKDFMEAMRHRETVNDILLESVPYARDRDVLREYLKSQSQYIRYSDSLADRYFDLVARVRALPTNYFEAKPARAVRLSEVKLAILPSTASFELRRRLAEARIPTAEYTANDEDDRRRVLEETTRLHRFSITAAGTHAPNTNLFERDRNQSLRLSVRATPPPKKTRRGYKLFAVDDQGRPHALFIDSSAPLPVDTWLDADSPDLAPLLALDEGIYLVDRDNHATRVELTTHFPPASAIKALAKKGDGSRFMEISHYANGSKAVYTIGINGSGNVAHYGMRPGWHLTDAPSARHICSGKGKHRRPHEQWFEVEYAADNDYNEEAAKSTSEAGGINDHIPTDGWYQFKTNTNADGNQKWIITGALRIGRALTREEGDAICDELGIAHDAPYETPAEEKPRASVTATAGNAAGEANDDTLNLYFKPDPAATAIPIASLHTLKDEPQKSINNARRFMDMSARGENDPRKPIAVADNGDGTYTVVDGNATTWAASQMGLTHVRAIVVGKNEGTRLRNSGLLVKNETPAEEQDADGKLHTRGLDGLSGEAAREKAYEQAEENIQTLSDITNEAAGIVGGTVLIRPVNKAGNNVDPREVGKAIKKRDRVNKKVASDYADDYSRCVDLIGTTLVMPDNGDYTDAVKKLRKAAEARGCTIAKVKKLNLVPNAQGYRDIKVSIRFPNGGIGEVIVVEEYINDAKFNRGGHEIYEAERMVEPIKDESDSANEAYRLLKALNEAVYGRGESAMPADAFERAKASASASLTRLLGEQNLSLSSEDTTELKSLSSKLQSAQPASVDSYAMPSLSFIQNDISQSPSTGSMDQTMQEVKPPQDPPSVADAMTKQEAKEFRTSITWDTSKREFSSMGYLTGYAVSREITGNPATDDELSRLAQALGVAADIKELKKSAKRYLKDAKPLSQSMPVAELIRTIASKRDDDRISDIVTSLYENAFAEGEDVGWRAARAWDKAVHLANLAAETYTREMMAAETGVDPVALLVELIPEAFDTRMEWKEQNAEDSGKSDGTDLERPDLPFDEAEARARALTAKMRENYSRVLHRAREIAAEMKRQRDAENEAAHQRFLDEQREKEAAKERFLDKLDDNGGLDETDDEKEAMAAKEEANRLQQDINTAAMIMALKECGKFVDLTTDLEFAAFLQAWVTDYIVQRNDINPEDVFKHPQHVATYRNTVKHVLAELADAMLDPSEDKAAVKVARQIGEIIAEWGPEEIAMASANIFADIQAAAVKQTRARLIRDAIAMVKDKTQYGNRLSPQDQEFVRLCLYEKKPIVDAYIAAYSPNTENRDKIKYYAERKLKRLSWALREETAFGDNRPMQEAFGNAGVSETVTKNKNHYLEVYGRYLARVLKMTTKDIEEEREKYQSIADQRERAYADASEQAKATGHAAVEAIDDVAIQDALMRLNILSTYGGLRDRKPSEIEAAFLSMQEFLDKKIAEHFEKWATIRQQWDSVATLLHDALEASTPSGITPPDSILANFSDAFFSVGQKLHLAAAAATPEQRRAVEYVVNLIAKGSEQYQVLMYQSRKDWNTAMEKACEGTGTKTSGLLQLLDEIVPEDLNAALITDDQRCTMTWSQVMQLYSSLLQTETYSNNILQHNRFEQIELIENAAPPVLIRFVAELRDIYARRRPELSRAVEAVTGLPVYSPDPLYMPAKMFIRRTEGLTTEVYGWSPLGKALTPRIKNGLDFDLSANLSSMYLDRAEVNARAIAFGMRGLALRSILTRSQNRLAMEHAVGTHAANSFVNHVSEVLTGNDTRRESNRAFTKIIATAVNWASLFTLSYNHSSPLRQMASVPVTSGLLKGGMWELAKNMFSFDLEAARALIHSPGFIARYGAEGIKDMFVDAIMDPSAGKIKRFYKFGMSGMKLGDIGACLIPGAGIYKARLAEILAENQGIDTEKAKEQAASETWAILDKTQQASRVENMPGILTKFGDTGKLFSQFTTSQIQQVGMEMFQFRMWRRARKLGNKQAAEEYGRKLRNTLIVNRLVMPALMHLVDTLLLALAAGEPPEKEELIVDAAMSLLLGPFGELFFISGIVSQFSGTASKALGAKSRMQFRQDSIPSLAVIQKLFNKGVLTTFDLITCDFDQALEDAIDLTGTVFAPIRFIDRRRTNLEMKKD